jgi:hypothetical protein
MESIMTQVSPPDTKIVEVSPKQVSSHHLGAKFPLWPGPLGEGTLAVDPAKAVSAGLAFRDLRESVDDVLAWWDDRDWPSWWLTREQEAMLVHNPR